MSENRGAFARAHIPFSPSSSSSSSCPDRSRRRLRASAEIDVPAYVRRGGFLSLRWPEARLALLVIRYGRTSSFAGGPGGERSVMSVRRGTLSLCFLHALNYWLAETFDKNILRFRQWRADLSFGSQLFKFSLFLPFYPFILVAVI